MSGEMHFIYAYIDILVDSMRIMKSSCFMKFVCFIHDYSRATGVMGDN